jgi:hypothetical protein
VCFAGALMLLFWAALSGGKDIALWLGISVCMSTDTLHTYTQEKPYGTRINHVAVRRTVGSDRAVVPVPCYLASQRRIGRVSHAAVRLMRRLSP